MKLTAKEQKLLLLAMDAAAAQGEIENAAVLLLKMLRERYGDGHKLVKDLETQASTNENRWSPPRPRAYNPAAKPNSYRASVFRMPFGKHRGKLLSQVPLDYLEWLLANVELYDRTRQLIERHLEQRYG
jgi:hypothetical protein